MKKKALAMLSGGLDSTLAIKVVLEQGIAVEAINYTSPFCQCNRKESGCGSEAKRVCDEFQIPLHFRRVGADYIEMIQNPKYGYGKNINPCQDCRIFMLKKAKELMVEIGASFIVTGEVLGQRPMSQHQMAFNRIEEDTGLVGLILRPLCALSCKPTIPEQLGIVNREKLLNITGRSRKPQIELAAHLGISDYPCPAGGCLLTTEGFSIKVRDAFAHGEDSLKDMRLLKIGRHLRLPSHIKIVAGRDEKENTRLAAFFDEECLLLNPLEVAGPTLLIKGNPSSSDIELAAAICLGYTKATKQERVQIERKENGVVTSETISAIPLSREQIYSLYIAH